VNPDALRRLLEAVRRGDTDVGSALDALKDFPSSELSEATVDQHRALRCGFPEVIFGQGKTTEQVLAIAERIVASGQALLATRLSPEAGLALLSAHPGGRHDGDARVFHLPGPDPLPPAALVAVISAGTSDRPVAEEAALTAEALGAEVRRVRDVGVAGLHRLLKHQPVLREASVLVVVAGMEGALPSVVGGLTDRPVIGVPTSVGYGAHLGGMAALLAMLNSCASGLTVVNIDNGFGAGYAAALIARQAASARDAGELP
jgi:hypothetical protein